MTPIRLKKRHHRAHESAVCKALGSRRGSMFVMVMVLFFILLAFVMVVLDYMHVCTTANSVDAVLERTALTVTETAARDNYRQEYESTLSEAEALELFREFAYDRLGLSSAGVRTDTSGKTVYTLSNLRAEVDEMGGDLTIQGTLDVPLRYYAALGITVSLPFEVTSSQIRID